MQLGIQIEDNGCKQSGYDTDSNTGSTQTSSLNDHISCFICSRNDEHHEDCHGNDTAVGQVERMIQLFHTLLSDYECQNQRNQSEAVIGNHAKIRKCRQVGMEYVVEVDDRTR